MKVTYLPKSDRDGVYNWPQKYTIMGRGSERPVAHTQPKGTQVPPLPPQKKITSRNGANVAAAAV